jgi:hypothetical protein
MLFISAIQKGSFALIKGASNIGAGRVYMILSSVRGVIDVSLTAAALLILIYGLTGYVLPGQQPMKTGMKLRKVMLGIVVFQCLVSVPINITGFIDSRTVFALLLGFSQTAHVAIVALIYWVVKEYHRYYHLKFFRYLTMYYGISFCIAGLIFTYSMGSFGLLQRFPAGEISLIGGFGQFVFCVSRIASILLNYMMFLAIAEYAEPNK